MIEHDHASEGVVPTRLIKQHASAIKTWGPCDYSFYRPATYSVQGYRFTNGSMDELKAKQKSDNGRLVSHSTSHGLLLTQLITGGIAGSLVWDIINKVDDRVHDLRKV